MSISKKMPYNTTKIDALINKGGTVPNAFSSVEKIIKTLQLRLPKDLIDQIDLDCQNNPYKVKRSRHSWILEAILEKIKESSVPNI